MSDSIQEVIIEKGVVRLDLSAAAGERYIVQSPVSEIIKALNKHLKWKSPKEVLDGITPKFEAIKPMLDAYPKAFMLVWSNENGYSLTVDLDGLERPEVTVDLSL